MSGNIQHDIRMRQFNGGYVKDFATQSDFISQPNGQCSNDRFSIICSIEPSRFYCTIFDFLLVSLMSK